MKENSNGALSPLGLPIEQIFEKKNSSDNMPKEKQEARIFALRHDKNK